MKAETWELVRDFMMLPYVYRAIILNQCGLLTDENWKKPHENILQECLDRLEREGRIADFESRVRKYQKSQKPQDGMTFPDVPDYPPEIAALAKAAEPLHMYLLERGDPHTCAVVTQYGVTLKRDEIGVTFAKDGGFEARKQRMENDIEKMRREMEGA